MKDNYPSVQFTERTEIGCIISYSNGERLIAKGKAMIIGLDYADHWKVYINFYHHYGDDRIFKIFPTEKEARDFIAYLSAHHEEYIKKYFRVD